MEREGQRGGGVERERSYAVGGCVVSRSSVISPFLGGRDCADPLVLGMVTSSAVM